MYRLFSLLVLAFLFTACSSNALQKTVTVYVSEDQVFSEPLLKDFEKESGIRVRAVYDTEESKSTGVMNRLIAEKNNPQADVYWANEPIRAEVLRQKGLLQPYQSPVAKDIPDVFKSATDDWTGFSARIRLFIVQQGMKDKPTSIMDYTKPEYKGKTVIANPLFGTTTSQMAALFSVWGSKKTEQFLADLKANDVMISTSNGESADFVASKSALFALVDSDDAVRRLKAGDAVAFSYPDQGAGELGVFVVPNAVMMIKGAPHPQAAKKLIDYLLSAESEKKLAFADCAQIPLHPGVVMPPYLKPMDELKVMQVDYAKVAQKMVELQPLLKAWLQK